MNTKLVVYLIPFVPLSLFAQQESPDVSMNDVTVVVDAEPTAPMEGSNQPATVIEIPDAEIQGASIDSAPEGIPVVSETVVDESDVVLELPGQSSESVGEATMASAETITVDFPDEDVRTILRNVADLFELNLVIPDTLQGRTSLKLRNITWRQVFEVVLQPLGYTFVEERNIIRIRSVDEITTEPVDTRVFVVNYATASEIAGSVNTLVDAAVGGQIQVDSRSNALVITERPSRMNKIQEIIESLDRPNHQVMIESRFVDVSKEDSENIGVDWSFITDDQAELPFGAPNAGAGITEFDGAGFGGFTAPTSFENGLVAVFSEENFAATLNALQTKDDIKLVSNPTVVVMNNSEALLQVGDDYPIREFTINPDTGLLETGAVEYRFVGIELRVTPSVNSAGMISLDVHPTVSERLEGETVSGPSGLEDQIFRTREATTRVTIKDGYTIALGGLTRQTDSKTRDQIPLLGDMPVLGKLFQSNGKTISNSNLIIFLTAKTLNPDGTTYREIIDPRKLDAVGHTPSQAPGYKLPEEQMELLRKAEEAREEIEMIKLKREIERGADKAKSDSQTWQEKLQLTNESSR